MTPLTYPNSIAVELERRLPPDMIEAFLPPSAVIDELCSIAFYASLEREERRDLRFQLAFTQPERHSKSKNCSVFLFAAPRPLAVTEVVKLAPALDPEQVAIGIRRSLQGELEIWGLLRYGRDRYRFLRGERTSSMTDEFSIASAPFFVEAYGAGSLLVSIGHHRALRFQAGRFIDSGVPVFRASKCPPYETLSTWAESIPHLRPGREFEYIRSVQQLVRGVHESGHGGTLVFLKEPSDEGLRLERGKTAQPFAELRDRLSDYVVGLDEECARMARTGEPPPAGLSTWDVVPRHALDDALSAVAAFAGVDGAVVLSRDLVVRSFGAVIDWTPTDPYSAMEALDVQGIGRSPLNLSLRGTRHNSAAWLCWKRSDALVFVVSEDGTLSCLHQVAGEVLVWRNVDANHEFALGGLIKGVEVGGIPLPKNLRNGATGAPLGPSLHGRS